MEPLIRAFAQGVPMRVVNFHCTPLHREEEYDRQLAELARRFAPCGEEDLLRFLSTGAWPRRQSRPGVVVALYNGTRDNYDVMRPLLDRHGLVGWFFVVSGWTGCPPEAQADFAQANRIGLAGHAPADGRHALSWDEVRELDRAGHVIASHTRTHSRVADGDTRALESEIVGSQDDFRRELGHPVRSFAWLKGAPFGENPVADALVGQAGYELLFSNLKVQRLPTPRSPEARRLP